MIKISSVESSLVNPIEEVNFCTGSYKNKIDLVHSFLKNIACLPLTICRNIHGLIGRKILRVVIKKRSRDTKLQDIYKKLTIDGSAWFTIKQYKIKIDGAEINAFALIRKIQTDRWCLISNGLGGRAINRLEDSTDLSDKFKANMLVFDYPGTGDSTGIPSRKALTRTYQAMLRVLQERWQVKQLILYGHSFGAGVQAEGIRSYNFQPGVDVVAIKSRTFSSLTVAAKALAKNRVREILKKNKFSGFLAEKASVLCGRVAQLFIFLAGWYVNTAEASRKLCIPEIILYTGKKDPTNQQMSEKAEDDGVIDAIASLPQGLGAPAFEKHLMSIPETHNDPLSPDTIQKIADKVEDLFSQARTSKGFSPKSLNKS